ncbi:MAG: LuxR C-terminal-related transcriptional regulator [Marmoricola sp.]
MAEVRRVMRRAKMEIPVVAGDVIERARLTSRLDALVSDDNELESFLVCAPPGFGKTTLVSSWMATLSERGYNVAMCNLEATESHTFRFWSLLLTSLSEALPDERLADLIAPHGTGGRGFVNDLAAALEGWRVVVVVENLHEIVDPTLLRDLDLWLSLVPSTTKVVLTSRSDPPLMSLQERRLRGVVDQLRASDLAFTPDELHQLAPDVASDARRSMWSRTEGWPALIRLLLMAARTSEAEPVLPRDDEDPVLAEYLFRELFRKQDVKIQTLMLICGVLETIPLDLVASITTMNESGHVLETLVTTSGLVTRTASPIGGPSCYRFPPLLRAYLHGELVRTTHPLESAIHSAAAPWFRARGLNVEAIRHACAGADPTVREDVVAGAGMAMVNAGESSLLLSALGDARSRRLATSPWTHVVAAAALLDLGRLPDAVGELNLVRAPAGAEDDLRTTRDAVALHVRRRKGERLPPGLPTVVSTDDPDVRLYWQSQLATALVWEGRREGAVDLLDASVELAQGLERDAVLIDSLTMLASADSARSDFRAADAHLDRAFATARQHGWGASPRLAYAHLLSAWSCRQRLDDDGARRHVSLARGQVHPAADPTVLGSVQALDGALRFEADPSQVQEVEQMHEVWRSFASAQVAPAWVVGAALLHARLSLRLHRANRVRESIEDVRRLLGECGELYLLEAMLEAANGRHRRALELLRAITSGEVEVVVPMSAVDAWAQEAALCAELGDSFAATAAARPALDLAAELGALRPLLDSGGGPLIALLQRERGRWGNHEPLVEQLIRAAQHTDAVAAVLTDRELEVLVELPTLRTVDEIAHSMYVSVNTVKTHLRNVYRKLGVTTRREAVEAARMHGLL